MAKFVTVNSSSEKEKKESKDTLFKKIWDWFWGQDRFNQGVIVTIAIVIILTPIIVTQRLLVNQRAAAGPVSVYFTRHGSPVPLANLTLSQGEKLELDLYLDATSSTVNGFDIITSLSNNNTLSLAPQGVTEGDSAAALFNVPIFNIWQDNNWRFTKVTTLIDSPFITGSNILLATISLSAVGIGEGKLEFSPDTLVTSPESPSGLAVGTQSLSYVVSNVPTNSPSQSPTPTPSGPQPTISGSPTATATPAAPTATRTPTPVLPTSTVVPPTSTLIPTATVAPTATPTAPKPTKTPKPTPLQRRTTPVPTEPLSQSPTPKSDFVLLPTPTPFPLPTTTFPSVLSGVLNFILNPIIAIFGPEDFVSDQFGDQPVIDTQIQGDGPKPPTDLLATVESETQINLSWNAPSDQTVVGYYVYRDGIFIGSVVSTSYGEANLINGKTYKYTVRAFDSSGRLSSQSNIISAAAGGTANINNGIINGKVTSGGAGVWGVRVEIAVSGLKKVYTTNSQGNYSINNLPAGNYDLIFQKNGFSAQRITVNVSAGNTTLQNIELLER